ncbi:aspartate aminotransferase family protein [Brevibacterium luteolum]|uniref:aspartate aminotransferase family protein n=1 Tax=Brevibacterium luteolum TaxID=199591 RepID=UPI001C23E1CE|nr:aspartate aminotransferase family protein [Brevibacterium luteolum]MBU8579985.1 aspartate aminotransferase family protein [Brevibacterium luteolum]
MTDQHVTGSDHTAHETTGASVPYTQDDLDRARRGKELDRKHVFHSWSAQDKIDPMAVVTAQGSRLWDADGNEYIDFSSQLVNTNIGHQHPTVVKAIQDQAARLCTIAPPHANDARSEAARLISELAPEGLNSVFFTNGGADANEHAVRMARLHTGRQKVLTAYRSFHGGTTLAVNLTGDPRRFANDTPGAGVVHFMPAYTYRSYFGSADETEETERALRHLEDMIVLEGPQNIAAVMLESIPGTAGIYTPPPGYLAGVRELTRRYGIMYIADEVMAGFGRAGEWFAIDHWGVTPDLITFAKGVNSGYVPLGGVIISDEIRQTFAERPYPGGLTYSGHPLATAAAVATINAMRDEAMVENAKRLGTEVIGPYLEKIEANHPSVGEVRGMGCFWALELVANAETREPLAPYGGSSEAMDRVTAEIKRNGVLPFTNFNRIHVVPPLNTPDDEVLEGLHIIDRALDIADEYVERVH